MGHQRPNDARHFLHKTILGIGSSILGTVANLPGVGFLPGSQFLELGSKILGGLSGRGRGPSLPILPGPAVIGAPLPIQARLPTSGPIQQNERVGIRPPEPSSAMFQQNGVCQPSTGIGNRRVNAAGQCAPPGWHWNVSSYTRRGGPCSKHAPGFVEAGTVLVRNRRMSKNNGKAEDRAIKRLDGSVDHAKKVLRATGYRTVSKQSSREMRMRRRGHR